MSEELFTNLKGDYMKLIRISEVIREWLGWCPNARTMRTAPAAITTPPVTVNPPVPDGGSGGSGRIDRGIRLALGSIKILIRNKRLLWFSLLIGLAMLFSLATSLLIQVISGTNPFPGTTLFPDSGMILLEKGSLPLIVLAYTLTFISNFISFYLLGGLYTYASFILSGRRITLREGLSRVGNHIRPLAGWALIGALIGTAFFFFTNIYTPSISIILISVVITTIFGALTIFVVPAVVLGDEGLFTAIMNSVSIFRKIWGEIIVCAGIFFLIAFGILLVTLVPITIIGFSSGSAAMVGVAVVLNMLVWIVILFIGSAIVGIATLGLYSYAKTDRLPELFTEK